MPPRPEIVVRDRALRMVRLSTTTAIVSALGLTGAFSTAAAMTFSGKPAAHRDAAPVIPLRAAPAQAAPPAPIVINQYVRVAYGSYAMAATSTGAPAAPAAQPGAAPPPPPPPACVSTPSKPC